MNSPINLRQPNVKFDKIVISKQNKQKENDKWVNRIATVTHILISFVRPRTFLSSVLIGLSSMIHKKFAAKGLIDAMSHIGLCASYHETTLFESSIINDPEQYKIFGDSFVQFSFDNANHDVNTIDGLGTFHTMGGIMMVTPSSCVTSDQKIPRLKSLKSLLALIHFGFTPLKYYENYVVRGFSEIIVNNLDNEFPDKIDILINDLVWLFEKIKRKPLDGVDSMKSVMKTKILVHQRLFHCLLSIILQTN